jgi:hypothetical protein
MPVYRYVKTPPGQLPEHLDVTFAGDGRDGLDASMREMGFEFSGVVSAEGPRGADPSLFFPGADGPEPITPRMPRAPGVLQPLVTAPADLTSAPGALQRVMTSTKGMFGMALSTRAAKALRVFRSEQDPSGDAVLADVTATMPLQRRVFSMMGRAPASAVLTLAIVAALFVHAKVLQSGFVDDDFLRALDARLNTDWGFVSSRFHGLFAGSYELGYLGAWELFHMDAPWYFRGILVSHLVNVALVYGVARALSGRTAIAALIAGLWGITPGFQGTLQSLAAFGTVISAGALCWALLEVARAAAEYRPPTAFALVRVNLALLVCAGGMQGAWLGVLLFPLAAHLLLPAESARGRSALFTLPAALASLAPAVAFVKDVAPAFGQPFAVFRIFIELLAYGTGVTVAGPFTSIHAHGRGAGLFRFPSYSFAILFSAGVALLVLGFLVYRLVKAETEERREIIGLVVLALALYVGVALHRADFLGKQRSIHWIAARAPQHYCANVPIVLALAAALGRVVRSEFTRVRIAVFAALSAGLVLVDSNVSDSTHALRPARAARVTELVDEAIRQLIRGVPDGEVAYIRNDDFPPVSRALERGLPKVRFPGIGTYWALSHGRAVPILAGAVASAPSPSGVPEPSAAPTPSAAPPAGGTVATGATPVRFVITDDALLKTIKQTFRPSISDYFVSPAEVNAHGAPVLTLDAAEAETLATLERARRAMGRVNDI